MLRNSCAGIGVCTTPERLFAKAVTVVRAAAIFFLVTILTHGSAANAAELKVFTSRAIATVLDKIGPEFERTTGHKLSAMVEPPHVEMTGYNRSSTEPLRVVIFYVSDPDAPFLDPVH